MITKPSYVADFETITRNGKECVWLFDICNIVTLTHNHAHDIIDFMEIIDNMKTGSTIYFHNLKFDGSFLIDYMIKNGYEFKNVTSNKLKKYQFNVLMTEFGSFVKMTYKNKNGKCIEFVDSLKILPLSVKKLAKDFNLDIMKGEIDYKKTRELGYKANKKEIAYVQNDTEIVAKCLKIFLENGNNKITISSCAFEDYMEIIGKSKYKAWFGEWERNATLELDNDIRAAYRGGFCQCNNDYVAKTIKSPVWYNDVNSLYPFVMRTAKLPYGMPKEFSGRYVHDEKFPYYIQKIQVDMSLKSDGIPCILNKSKGPNCKYIVDTLDGVGNFIELTLTCFDFELMIKNYDINEIKFLGGYKFAVRNDMFTDYVDKYYKMKQNATITENWAMRTIAKLFLNSLYGKFGQNPVRRKKLPYVDMDGKIKYYKSEKSIAKKFKYLPIAVFITSIARYKILNDIEKIGKDNWVYTDTDSILSTVRLPNDMIDNEKLGLYKIEHVFKKTRVLGPKTYWGKDIKNEIICKACGCNKKALHNFPIGKFNFGNSIKNGRVTLKTVVGGKKLDFADFTIRDKLQKQTIINRIEKPIDIKIKNSDWK